MPQSKPNSFITAYEAKLADGSLRTDAGQRKAAEAFELLFQQLTMPETPLKLRWLRRKAAAVRPAGLYVWGDVGRGKSMLMDLFVQVCTSPRLHDGGSLNKPKQTSRDPVMRRDDGITTRRVHFHAFMRDVHKRLFAYRQSHSGEVIEQVIAEIAAEINILCLDELQVTDVTDAMILSRLFEGLMDAGVTVLFTSNRQPNDLYQGGLQREQFLKFVDLLVARLPIIRIDSPEDYRLAQLRAMKQTYYYPRNEAADDFLLERWSSLTQNAASEPLRIEIDGRILRVDKHANGVAWLTFAELCVRPLGASDYLELCSYCHTIILQGIPQLTREDRNEAKRFVTLIDALYDHRIKLIATAQTAPDGIYEAGDGTFEFGRTVSRLMEMQSEAYLGLAKL
jgi:cell division protein ZapE